MNSINSTLEQVMRRQDTWRGRPPAFRGIPAGGIPAGGIPAGGIPAGGIAAGSVPAGGISTGVSTRSTAIPANSEDHCTGGVPAGGLATGYSALDAALVHGGWPPGTSIEVLSDGCGMGAMGLFLPAMEKLSAQGRWQAFIAPPYTPYAPLLAARGIDTGQVLLVHPKSREDLLWSTEQALRSTTCSAVFSWLGAGEYRYSELRKLQLAAADSDTLAVLFRASQAACNHAPAGLRLQMREYRQVHVLKQRGGQQGLEVNLSPTEDVPHQPQLWELPVSDDAAVSASALGTG